jgi:hypothetical protein
MAWLGGFFSATNWWVMDADRNDIQNDDAAIDVWIRKWCEQNPTKRLIEAAADWHISPGHFITAIFILLK